MPILPHMSLPDFLPVVLPFLLQPAPHRHLERGVAGRDVQILAPVLHAGVLQHMDGIVAGGKVLGVALRFASESVRPVQRCAVLCFAGDVLEVQGGFVLDAAVEVAGGAGAGVGVVLVRGRLEVVEDCGDEAGHFGCLRCLQMGWMCCP
jgi:hypothetical protein